MKSNIKLFIGILIGLVISGGVVYATGVLASEISYKNGTVQDALDDLYSAPQVKKFCELKSGTALTIGSKYECDPGDGTKRNFYVLAVDTNKVKLIMEHNITEGTSATTMTWMNAIKYIDNNLVSSWINVLDVDLPSAQDIANAVGNTSWKIEDKNASGWFYLDSKNEIYGQTQVASASNLSNFAWLYNYTRECSAYGCDASTSLSASEAYGYWAKEIVSQASDSKSRAWRIYTYGHLDNSPTNLTDNGVRPVITVLKSNLSN